MKLNWQHPKQKIHIRTPVMFPSSAKHHYYQNSKTLTQNNICVRRIIFVEKEVLEDNQLEPKQTKQPDHQNKNCKHQATEESTRKE